MSRFKYLISGIALLLMLTATTSTEARNTPRVVDQRDQYSHPWGGDENPGGQIDLTAAPVQPDGDSPYRYLDGTKSGLVAGAVQFFWKNVELYLFTRTYANLNGAKTSSGGSVTSTSIAGSTTVDDAKYGGKGGQW